MQCVGFIDCAHTLATVFGPPLVALLLGTGYVLLLLCVRRVWIISRNTVHLHAYADMVEARLTMEQDKPDELTPVEGKLIPRIRKMLHEARAQVPVEEKQTRWRSCLTIAGVGRQLAAWRMVHDADRMVTDLWSPQQGQAYATVAKGELKAGKSPAAGALSESIAKIVDKENGEVLRPLVKEARGLIFEARDNYYEGLSDWQNKALWLVVVTAAIVVLLAAVLGHATFLLLGATGGLLARLSKTMTAKTIGFDYGVSWSVLFLAPLVGALTGWAGVLVSDFVAEMHVLNLPAIIQSTCALANDAKMVLAVLFGFSATLFEGVMSGAEAALTKKPAGGSSGSQK